MSYYSTYYFGKLLLGKYLKAPSQINCYNFCTTQHLHRNDIICVCVFVCVCALKF